MSSRSASALLLLLCAAALWGQDWEGFAAASDRSKDPVILQALAGEDLETRLAICRGLGRRPDASVGALVRPLLEASTPRGSDRTELLLRVLLQSAADSHSREEDLRDWASANESILDDVLAHISCWKSPQLQSILLRFAAVRADAQAIRAIMEVGASLVNRLQAVRGLISPEEAALALDYLSAVRRIPRDDFLEQCAAISRLSRDKAVVDAARAAAGMLASRA